MRSIVIPVLAAALAASCPAFAQNTSSGNASEQGNLSSSAGKNAVLSINKLKQDLQKAGFSDVRVIADLFVVQAKDKEGNPTIMTLSPSGVFAISEITKNNQKQAKAGMNEDSNEGSGNMQHE